MDDGFDEDKPWEGDAADVEVSFSTTQMIEIHVTKIFNDNIPYSPKMDWKKTLNKC